MFGYIQVFKDELKFKEYSLYRYHYCELCRNMGRYSNISRIFLSYDITFFLMLGEPVSPNKCDCQKCLFTNCQVKKTDGIYDYFAALSIALIYHKLNNDVIDGESIKRIPQALITHAYKNAKKRYPDIAYSIEKGLQELVSYEKGLNTDFSFMAGLFSKTVSDACAPFFSSFSDGEIRLHIIESVACCVYLLDIVDDVDKDYKKKDYNPINILANGKAGITEISDCISRINDELTQATSLSMLLPYSDCLPIIQNILSLGIPNVLRRIKSKYSL